MNETTPETTVNETKKNTEQAVSTEFTERLELPQEVREAIDKKAAELKAQLKIRKIYVAVVKGDADDDKPFYIAYLRRPALLHFSQYMNFVQKDFVQANKMLAQQIFLAGDRELIDDDDLFIYGLMGQLNSIIDVRSAELVKR